MIENLLLEAVHSWGKEIHNIECDREWIADNSSEHKVLTEKIAKKKSLIEEAQKVIQK